MTCLKSLGRLPFKRSVTEYRSQCEGGHRKLIYIGRECDLEHTICIATLPTTIPQRHINFSYSISSKKHKRRQRKPIIPAQCKSHALQCKSGIISSAPRRKSHNIAATGRRRVETTLSSGPVLPSSTWGSGKWGPCVLRRAEL